MKRGLQGVLRVGISHGVKRQKKVSRRKLAEEELEESDQMSKTNRQLYGV